MDNIQKGKDLCGFLIVDKPTDLASFDSHWSFDRLESMEKKEKNNKKDISVSDLSEILKPYSSGWVALSDDEEKVIGNGQTLEEARQKAVRNGYLNEPIFMKIIPPDQGYIPFYL